MQRVAHAKINLSLHVTGQREDGYHLLDSLVVFTQFGDVITLSKNENPSSLIQLKIDGPFSKGLDEGANNLVSRAALALAYKIMEQDEKPVPVTITLTKNLPVASGIGGGSADAAATLNALTEFWGVDLSLNDIALEIGADVPMCLHSKPLQIKGIGDEISLLNHSQPLHLVLVNPNIEVSTPSIFKRLHNKHNTPLEGHDIQTLNLGNMRNDLQAPAIELAPEIADVLEELENTDCSFNRMSGSGATCFGMFDTLDQAQKAANEISSKHPDWWCIATSTTVS